MLEGIVLGTIQGLAEWLPISSEGLIVLVKTHMFDSSTLSETIQFALFLHIGTFFAALVYFWNDVKKLFRIVVKPSEASAETKTLFKFLLFTTLISGALGFGLLKIIISVEHDILSSTRVITFIVGLLLLFTALAQLRKKIGVKKIADLGFNDAFVLGIVQGLTILPGLSRSGLTVAGLLFRKIDDELALKISFLMSMPVVLGANIVLGFLNTNNIDMNVNLIIALFFSFLIGLLTIHVLLIFARKAKIAWFIFAFGLITMASVFI